MCDHCYVDFRIDKTITPRFGRPYLHSEIRRGYAPSIARMVAERPKGLRDHKGRVVWQSWMRSTVVDDQNAIGSGDFRREIAVGCQCWQRDAGMV